MRTFTVLIAGILVLASTRTAHSLKEEERETVRKQISSVKAWQMTQDLDLTEEQAQTLFPAQKAFEDRKKQLSEQRSAVEKELDDLLEAKEKDKDVIKGKMVRLKEIDKQIRTSEDEFRGKRTRILNVEQQAKYELFEKKFDTKLRQMIRDVQKEDLEIKARQESDRYRPSQPQKREAVRKEQPERRQQSEVKKRSAADEDERKKKSASQDRNSTKERSSSKKESSQDKSSREEDDSEKRSSRENGSSKTKSSRSSRR